MLALLAALALLLPPPASADDPFAVAAPAPEGFDRAAAGAACLAHLEALIGIDTSNLEDPDPADPRPNGNELQTALWFQRVLADIDGVETHVLEVGAGRANFIARLAAGQPTGRPVLILGHMDTVGSDPGKWDTPPTEATIVDGYLYGRGAIDCKGPLSAELTAFVALAARRATLHRDVVLLATAGEEGGPPVGIDQVLEHQRDLLGDPEFALNEGGRVRIGGGRIRSINVQTTEKIYYDVIATATGPSGHASVPLPDDALAALARACARVHEWRAPAHLNETTATFFAQQAKIEDDPLLAGAMALLGGEDIGEEAFDRAVDVLDDVPLYNAVLRAGQSLTILEGGFRSNVIPSSGTATFNLRVLPDDDAKAIVAQMEAVGAEPAVHFALDGDVQQAPPPSPLDTALYQAMAAAGHAMAPGAVVIPFMSTGATDGAALRAIGIPTYGILPIPLELQDELRMHGDNERAPVDGLGWAAEYIYRVLLGVAG